jgi:hypothetical protein
VQHPDVELDEIVFGEQAARDPGLIGNDENEVASFVAAATPGIQRKRSRLPT